MGVQQAGQAGHGCLANISFICCLRSGSLMTAGGVCLQSLNNNFAAEEGFVGNKLAPMNPNYAEMDLGQSTRPPPTASSYQNSYSKPSASPPRSSSPPKNDIPQDNQPDAVDAISFYKQVKQVTDAALMHTVQAPSRGNAFLVLTWLCFRCWSQTTSRSLQLTSRHSMLVSRAWRRL